MNKISENCTKVRSHVAHGEGYRVINDLWRDEETGELFHNKILELDEQPCGFVQERWTNLTAYNRRITGGQV